jgi:hypothetical protein
VWASVLVKGDSINQEISDLIGKRAVYKVFWQWNFLLIRRGSCWLFNIKVLFCFLRNLQGSRKFLFTLLFRLHFLEDSSIHLIYCLTGFFIILYDRLSRCLMYLCQCLGCDRHLLCDHFCIDQCNFQDTLLLFLCSWSKILTRRLKSSFIIMQILCLILHFSKWVLLRLRTI